MENLKIHAPDIDIDLDLHRNEFVKNTLPLLFYKQSYGLISAFVTLNIKNSLQDILRVFGVPFEIFIKITKDLDEENWEQDFENKYFMVKSYLDKSQEHLKNNNIIIDDIKQFIKNYVNNYKGTLRQTTKHAAGVIIGKELEKNIPLRINEEIPIAEFDLDQIENMNFLKLDLLTLRTLSVVQECVNQIRKEDPNFKINDYTKFFDDKNIYKEIDKGNLAGVFQLGTKGGKELCNIIRLKTFLDIVAINSLNRPGTKNMVQNYINPVYSEFEVVNKYTEETRYVVLFQEQLNKILADYLNIDEGIADLIRREWEKINGNEKKAKEIYHKFYEYAKKNRKKDSEIKSLFNYLQIYSGYLFNKSHAICYSILSIITLYLKVYYPLEFYSSCLKFPTSNAEEKEEIFLELRKNNIKFEMPEVNFSDYKDFIFDKKEKKIYYNLSTIKNFSNDSAKILQELRPFKSYYDFLQKVFNNKRKLNSKKIEVLIKVGALRKFNSNSNLLLIVK